MSLWPWLEEHNPETVSDFISRIYVRNVDLVIALDPSLHPILEISNQVEARVVGVGV